MKYFENYVEEAKAIKGKLSRFLREFELFVFGSAVRGDYSPGLSDIDVAVVSEEFNDRKKLEEVYDFLWDEYFDSPFEFHLLTKKKWEFYRKFVGKDYIKV